MGWARKGRFAVGEFKQSGELFERPWACRQAGAQPSEPRHPLQEKDIDFGVFYFFIFIWDGLEKAGSPQANSNNSVNYLKGRGRVHFVLFLHSS